MESKIWLRVPFSEKDHAKAAGARWDALARRWWISPRMYGDFLSNMPSWIVGAEFSIRVDGQVLLVESVCRCSGCGAEVPVVGILATHTRELMDGDDEGLPPSWSAADAAPAYLGGLRAVEDERLWRQLRERWRDYRPNRFGRYRNTCQRCGREFHEENELLCPGGALEPREAEPVGGRMRAHALSVAMPAFFSADALHWTWSDNCDLFKGLLG